MWRVVTEWLDRAAIRSACRSVRRDPGGEPHLAEAEDLLRSPDFFSPIAASPRDFEWIGATDFRFTSALPCAYREVNQVRGKVFKAGREWRKKPAMVLVHGWNGEMGYRYQFPWLARRMRMAGFTVAMLELPYHASRKPLAAGVARNFITQDLRRVVEATRQAVADIRSLVAWLSAQGAPLAGLWGFSLGALLTSITAGCDARVRMAVLASPVLNMRQAILELPFCEPIRRGLKGHPFNMDRLDPLLNPPRAGTEGVLILESTQDLFAPPATIEMLWEAWGHPEIWRLPHGHISVMGSAWVQDRAVRWLRRKAAMLRGASTSGPEAAPAAGKPGTSRFSLPGSNLT